MKHLPSFHLVVLILGAIALLASCSNRRTAATLNDVESYIASRPDSALATLRTIDTTALTTRALKAHYALLHAMALDKNWIDTTDTGVIMPAVSYYSRHNSPDRRAKAYYYLGRIYYNRKNYTEATLSFTHSQECAANSKDYRFKSLIFQAMADTYSSTYLPEEALMCTDSSYKYCMMAEDTSLAVSSLFRKAQILNNLKRFSEADTLLSYIIINKRFVVPQMLPHVLADKAMVTLSGFSDYTAASRQFDTVVSLYGKLPSINHWCAYAYSLAASGAQQKSKEIFEAIEKTKAIDSYSFKTWKSKAEAMNKEFSTAYLLLNEAMDKQVEQALETLRQSTIKAQRDYYFLERSKAEESRHLSQIIVVLSNLSLVIIIIVGVLLFQRKQERDKRNKELLEKEKNSLQEAVTALSERVTEMNVQQAQLQKEYIAHLQSSFREWGQLYKAYYHHNHQTGIDIRDNVYFEAKTAIAKLAGDKEGQRLLEQRLNVIFDGVMMHYRTDFPEREEVDYRFASFVFSGFDASVLKAAFQIPSLPATYERKSRLKESILRSSAKYKEQYLCFFR